jgi:uncharacterized membrane protein YqjE
MQPIERGGEAPPPELRAATGSLIDQALGLVRDLPALVGDRVELLSLELQRAGLALTQVLALTVVAAILGVTAWLALWGIVVAALVEYGWHVAAAQGLVIVINIAAAAWAILRARSLVSLLGLPATRRHLTPRTSSSARASSHATPNASHDDEHAAQTASSAAAG